MPATLKLPVAKPMTFTTPRTTCPAVVEREGVTYTATDPAGAGAAASILAAKATIAVEIRKPDPKPQTGESAH
jgi:hypothetical protein